MFGRVIVLLVLLAVILGGVGVGVQQWQDPNSLLNSKLSELTNNLPNVSLPQGISLPSLPVLQQPVTEITTPGPLRGRTDAPAQTLTASGTIAETNRHRAEAGLPALPLNAKLAAAAQAKVNDMFQKQYFDHIGPDGRGPADWVEDTNYAYIAVGENLALGNFAGDAALVNAWMSSPGHRANILNQHFAEIGVATAQGTFQGEQTWLAVQTFGTPSSACPGPSPTLRQQFDQKKALTEQIEVELDRTQAELERLIAEHDRLVREGNQKIEEGNAAARRGDQEEAERLWAEGEALHNQARELEPKIEERRSAYNSFIDQLNAINNELIDLANQLNAQIDQYNLCVARFGS
ncbi:MAG: CAP domain-containing protein [Patescibacteria group bacterium]